MVDPGKIRPELLIAERIVTTKEKMCIDEKTKNLIDFAFAFYLPTSISIIGTDD